MKYLFEPEALAALRVFLRGNPLIGLDYDGTLAPIAPTPEEATLPASTRSLLGRLTRRRPLIVLTGRSRADALRLLSGIPVLEVIGSHGFETQAGVGGRFLRRVAEWRAKLADRLRAVAGVRIEDKRHSLSVHYRQAADPSGARELISRVADELEGARIVGGKKVVNVVPREAPDKGEALLTACRRLGYERALYVGDDETDESVFAAAPADRTFTIRVGRAEASRAAFYLETQSEMDALLKILVEGPAAAA